MTKPFLKTEEELQSLLDNAGKQVSVGSVYAHYKDLTHTYLVTGLSIMRYTGDVCVLYQAQYGKKLSFVRTLAEWFLPGERDGKEVVRFIKS
jgi:hypothetical protein